MDPKAQMMLITPINDHNLSSKSIVISADEEVTVELGKRRSQKDEMVEVSFDGDSKVRLEVGDRFEMCIRDSSHISHPAQHSQTILPQKST